MLFYHLKRDIFGRNVRVTNDVFFFFFYFFHIYIYIKREQDHVQENLRKERFVFFKHSDILTRAF